MIQKLEMNKVFNGNMMGESFANEAQLMEKINEIIEVVNNLPNFETKIGAIAVLCGKDNIITGQ